MNTASALRYLRTNKDFETIGYLMSNKEYECFLN